MSKLQLLYWKFINNSTINKPVKILLLSIIILSIIIIIVIIIFINMKINSSKIKLLIPPVGKYECEMMEYSEIWSMYKLELLPDSTAKYSMGDYSRLGSWIYSKDTKILVISNNIGKYKFTSMDSMYEIYENGDVVGWGTNCNRIK